MSKILVCMTIQQNSKRLIDEGFKLSQSLDGELHILHIEKGESIFNSPKHPELFQELFNYAANLGGQVHFLSSSNVPSTINQFIKDTGISHLIIGKPDQKFAETPAIYKEIKTTIKDIELVSLNRTD